MADARSSQRARMLAAYHANARRRAGVVDANGGSFLPTVVVAVLLVGLAVGLLSLTQTRPAEPVSSAPEHETHESKPATQLTAPAPEPSSPGPRTPAEPPPADVGGFREVPALPEELSQALLRADGGQFDVATLEQHARQWPQARAALGHAALAGASTSNEYRQALRHFEDAAKQGDPDAMFQMGVFYRDGAGVQENLVDAAAWFVLAASYGHAGAEEARAALLKDMAAQARLDVVRRARSVGPDAAAGWFVDPNNPEAAVWLPSWYRTGAFTTRVEASSRDGRAHGRGTLSFGAQMPGESSQTFEGMFEDGVFYGDSTYRDTVHMLKSDRFLLRLPETDALPSATLWLSGEFGVSYGVHRIAVDPCYEAPTSQNLVVAITDGSGRLSDDVVRSTMLTAWATFRALCPKRLHGGVTLVPSSFTTGRNRYGLHIYTPQLARASIFGAGTAATVRNFHNLTATMGK